MHPKRSPASHLQCPPSMRESPNLTPPVSWPMTSNSSKVSNLFTDFELLPTTKGATSWHKLGTFHCSCCTTHCCIQIVAMRGYTSSNFFVLSYFSPFQARLDKDLESTPGEPRLVRLTSSQTNHLSPSFTALQETVKNCLV